MITLTALTKKRSTSEPFKMTQEGRAAFAHIKRLLAHQASQLVIMNEEDPLILYTNVSTKAIRGVLMQLENGIEKLVIFVSHILSDQATLANHGVGTLCFRLLCKTTCSQSKRKDFYSSYRP